MMIANFQDLTDLVRKNLHSECSYFHLQKHYYNKNIFENIKKKKFSIQQKILSNRLEIFTGLSLAQLSFTRLGLGPDLFSAGSERA